MDTAATLARRFRQDHLALTAGSLTFTTLMALVPLLAVVFALFTAFPRFAALEEALRDYVFRGLVPQHIAEPLMGALTEFTAQAMRLGTLGFVVLVVTAIALLQTIDRTLNNIWRVRRLRPVGQRVLIYWAALTLGPVLLGLSITLTSYAVSASAGWVAELPGGVGATLWLAEFTLLTLAMAALFHYVPNTRVRWGHALAGGLFVALGFQVTQALLGWYLSQVPVYTTVFGAFATIPILLIWLYASWVVVLLGAVIAAYAPSLQMRVSRLASRPGHRFRLALMMLTQLRLAQEASDLRGLTVESIAQDLRVDPLQLEAVLPVLQGLNWVGRLETDELGRLVLLCNPHSTPLAPLVQELLLEPQTDVRVFWEATHLGQLKLAQVLPDAPKGAAAEGLKA